MKAAIDAFSKERRGIQELDRSPCGLLLIDAPPSHTKGSVRSAADSLILVLTHIGTRWWRQPGFGVHVPPLTHTNRYVPSLILGPHRLARNAIALQWTRAVSQLRARAFARGPASSIEPAEAVLSMGSSSSRRAPVIQCPIHPRPCDFVLRVEEAKRASTRPNTCASGTRLCATLGWVLGSRTVLPVQIETLERDPQASWRTLEPKNRRIFVVRPLITGRSSLLRQPTSSCTAACPNSASL